MHWEAPGDPLERPWGVPEGLLEGGSASDLQKGTSLFNFGVPFWTLFGPLRAPWEPHGALGPQKVSSWKGFFSDLILDSVLDPPKCAQAASRYSLSSIFTISACLKMAQKWTPKWTLLSSKISTWLLLRALGSDFGSHFWASESRLKNGSKKNRVCADLGTGRRPGQAGGGVGGAWNLHF